MLEQLVEPIVRVVNNRLGSILFFFFIFFLFLFLIFFWFSFLSSILNLDKVWCDATHITKCNKDITLVTDHTII